MGLQTFQCQNCGTPLAFEPGAESVTCPSCRGVSYAAKTDEAGIREVGLAAAEAGTTPTPEADTSVMAGPDAYIRLQASIAELEHLRDRYRNDFLPTKEKVGAQLDNEMAAYEREIASKGRKLKPWHCFLFAFFAFMAAGGERRGNDPDAAAFMSGFFALVAIALAIMGLHRKFFAKDPRVALRRQKKDELSAVWRKWLDEDRKFNDRMSDLSARIAKHNQ